MPDERPKLRPIDLSPVQTASGQQFLLRDPQRISPGQLVVGPDVAFLIAHFDGSHTLREAQVSYVRRFGSLITTDQIEAVLRRLDEALLLDTDRFRKFAAQVEEDFRCQPVRAPSHAGQAYPDGAAAFIQAWEPRLAAAAPPDDFALDDRRPALVAPHYDMSGAADAYAVAYSLLQQVPQPEVVVILGTAHTGRGAPFTLTRKPFETPFGALETDSTLIDALAEAAPFDLFADEFIHRDEHSIEFQAVLLHFLYREAADPPMIVPLLCAAYHRSVGQAYPCPPTVGQERASASLVGQERAPASNGDFAAPRDVPAVNTFLDSLRDLLAADSRRVAVIASADLSHIGARFAQPPVSAARLDLARRHDLALLEHVKRGDADGLYAALAEAQDRYNVCGFPCLYALLRTLPIHNGRLLTYKQATEPQTQSCVSFASVGVSSGS